ncbi:MAG: serine hydrolase [Candidatus Aminicenantes bacterium]|nr:serine hydrolase [Candidatus Aminicenantes bacterium]
MNKSTLTSVIGVLLLTVGTSVSLTSQDSSTPAPNQRLIVQIEQLVSGMEGTAGVAAKHMETGDHISINGDEYFPMASVFKLPVLVELMAQSLEGTLSLDEEIRLQSPDQHLGSGILSGLDTPGITLSVRNLIKLMMQHSDNSATDILFNMVKAENVNARLETYGIDAITVNRSCQHLIMDAIGLDFEAHKGMSLEEVITSYRVKRQENPDLGKETRETFTSVMKDQSTPEAMNTLLEKIWNHEILDPESCQYILNIMLGCETGVRRIKAGLPPGIPLAHKTGTIGGTVNNTGIIYLPEGLGHVALTVFFKDTQPMKTAEVEDKIAEISRYVYDYFYFTVPAADSLEDIP